jgi:hypothetical protein
MLVAKHSQFLLLNYPLLILSRMVRPGGRGRGHAPERPPPPDYMAAMMQQFELNRQFMTGIMAQFLRQNNQNQNQNPPSITLPEFM